MATSGTAYYNENDPKIAAWLRRLIATKAISDGEVDERSVVDVAPADLRGFTRCHFFAGIGGWDVALGLAGWPDERAVWTGSCPCQPFSQAGIGLVSADPRHLWPAWFHLIRECRPVVVFGEQIAGTDGLGWIDLVHADMEATGYALGSVDLGAPCVGAYDARQRLYFVARLMGDADEPRLQGRLGVGVPQRADQLLARPTGPARLWRDCVWLQCDDGKARPVESGTFPLADGVPARVGRLRGYGNAIKPQVAAEVIAAFMELD